jgi:hypothetical protein
MTLQFRLFLATLLLLSLIGLCVHRVDAQTASPITLTQSHDRALAGTLVAVTAKQSGATECSWITGGSSEVDPEVRVLAALASTMARTVTLSAIPLRHGMTCKFPAGEYVTTLRVEVETLDQIHAALTCLPSPLGKGSLPYTSTYNVGSSNVGACAAWFCPTATGFSRYGACATVRELAVAPYTYAQLTAFGEAKSIETWKASPTRRSLTNLERSTLEKLWAANAPAQPTFVTAKNGTYASRPVYTRNADGSRSTAVLADARVGIGVRCNCSVRTSESSLYCSVAGQPNLAATAGATLAPEAVALCIRG